MDKPPFVHLDEIGKTEGLMSISIVVGVCTALMTQFITRFFVKAAIKHAVDRINMEFVIDSTLNSEGDK